MRKLHTNPHSAGILMPEESRTELIQFCDKKRLCGACDTKRYAKIFDLRIFAFSSLPQAISLLPSRQPAPAFVIYCSINQIK
jgi:hypothetical protein